MSPTLTELRMETPGQRTLHGHARRTGLSPTFSSWRSMLARCQPTHRRQAAYHSRGITVCPRWRVFTNFLADMGERPVDGSLERRDNDRGYEPGNCYWASAKEQARNRRSTKLTGQDVQFLREWAQAGMPTDILAQACGVSVRMVQRIVKGDRWS